MTTVKLTRAEFQAPPDLFEFLGGLELARLFLEHHRNIVPDREREAVGLADEFRLFPPVDQRSFANGADENVKQPRVHGFVPV